LYKNKKRFSHLWYKGVATLFCVTERFHGATRGVQKEPRCSSPAAAEIRCYDQCYD